MALLSENSLQNFLNAVANGPTNYAKSHHLNYSDNLVVVLGSALAELVTVYVLVYGVFKLIQNIPSIFRATLRRFGVGKKEAPQKFLELTFPADTTKSAFATEQLHILLRGMVKYYGFWDKLAARKKPYSYELVGTNDDGIRFILMVPESEADIIRRNLLSFLPGLKVRETEDYASNVSDEHADVIELKLNGDFILPLKDHKALEEHDLMAFLSGHMTKLLPDELVAFQIVCVPVYLNTHHRVMRRRQHIETRIALGKEIMSQIKRQRSPVGYVWWLLWYPPLWFLMAMGKIVTFFGGLMTAIILGYEGHSGKGEKRRPDNPYDIEMGRVVKEKLDQQLYEVTIRILVSSPDQATHYSRINALVESFKPFRSTYQSFGTRQHVPVLSPKRKNLEQFRQRVLSPHHLTQQTILSSSELTDLYHFPNAEMAKAEGFVKSRSRELAAPLSVRRSDAKLDVLVGVNRHGGSVQPIGMPLPQRQKHTYIVGKTGTGKTTMLTGMIYQDMVNGKGIAVLDPHGDLFRELLEIVPEHRREDVIVFDPSDRDYPVGLNILDPGIEFANVDDKNEWITSSVISVFERLADKKQWGPRMEHILRNATLTALQLPNPSLYTIQRLLTEKGYQWRVAKTLKDPVLRQFWAKEFKLLGTMQLASVTMPVTHRLGHFITSKMSRHILLQEKSTIRIADIMDEGKILLVNLSKGDIGEDQSFFFGTILSSLIWMGAYQRTKIPEPERRDFFLYVDEFQNFATKQFTDITSEGRKFHISLTASHQNIAQVEDQSILKIVAGNAHAIICLKANPEDEAFILPYMRPEVAVGDIVNLAPYHFFMKTSGEVSEDAFSGETVPFEVEKSENVAKEVIAQSREKYGAQVKKVEAYLEVLMAEPKKKPRKPRNGSKDAKGKPKRADGKPEDSKDSKSDEKYEG